MSKTGVNTEGSVIAQMFNSLFLGTLNERIEKVNKATTDYLTESLKEKSLAGIRANASIDKIANQVILTFVLVDERDGSSYDHKKTWTDDEIKAAEVPVTVLIERELDLALKDWRG